MNDEIEQFDEDNIPSSSRHHSSTSRTNGSRTKENQRNQLNLETQRSHFAAKQMEDFASFSVMANSNGNGSRNERPRPKMTAVSMDSLVNTGVKSNLAPPRETRQQKKRNDQMVGVTVLDPVPSNVMAAPPERKSNRISVRISSGGQDASLQSSAPLKRTLPKKAPIPPKEPECIDLLDDEKELTPPLKDFFDPCSVAWDMHQIYFGNYAMKATPLMQSFGGDYLRLTIDPTLIGFRFFLGTEKEEALQFFHIKSYQ